MGENEQCSHPSAASFCLSGPACSGDRLPRRVGTRCDSLLFLLIIRDPLTTIYCSELQIFNLIVLTAGGDT